MKMKDLYSNYKKLVEIKFSEGTFMPRIDMSQQMYLGLMYIEEAHEITYAANDHALAFLELTDFVGVHYLFQRYMKLDLKKPLRLVNDVYSAKDKLTLTITRWLRDRVEYTAIDMIKECNEFIGTMLNHYSLLFNYDYYKLMYLTLAINGLKMISKEKRFDQLTYKNILEKFDFDIEKEFLQFVKSRDKEMNVGGKYSIIVENVEIMMRGVKSW